MNTKNLYKKYIKGKISRWHVELIILGILISPMILMLMWLNEQSASDSFNPDSVRLALVGIAAGIIGLGIWTLGASVIIINLIKAMILELQKLNAKK